MSRRANYSFLDALRDIATGRAEFVPQEQFLERLDVCNKCNYFAHLTKQCKSCGCFVHAKAKFKHAACPMNFWRKYEQNN